MSSMCAVQGGGVCRCHSNKAPTLGDLLCSSNSESRPMGRVRNRSNTGLLSLKWISRPSTPSLAYSAYSVEVYKVLAYVVHKRLVKYTSSAYPGPRPLLRYSLVTVIHSQDHGQHRKWILIAKSLDADHKTLFDPLRPRTNGFYTCDIGF